MENFGGDILWTKPRAGLLKVNVDVVILDDQNIGVGCTLHNEHGEFIRAIVKIIPGSFTLKEVEVLSIQEALS